MKRYTLFLCLLAALCLLFAANAEEAGDAGDAAEFPWDAAEESGDGEEIFPQPEPAPETDSILPDATAHLRAVGDLMVHDHQREIAKKRKNYDFASQFEMVHDSLSLADYTIGNLETVIDTSRPYEGFPTFNTPHTFLYTLKNAGIDFLSMANNHMLDWGFEGLCSTVHMVDEYEFDHSGAYASEEEASRPAIVEVKGIRIGFLCYTQTSNHKVDVDYGFCLGALPFADYASDVAKMREAGAEFIIAFVHWGTEYIQEVEEKTQEYAKKLIIAGVDMIIGSHPHVIQPIDLITYTSDEGVTKQIPVAWSLGNFISNQNVRYSDCGIILDFTIRRENGACSVENIGYVPVYVWNREKSITVLPSGKYYKSRAKGMSDYEFTCLRRSVKDTVKLIGTDRFTPLAE